MKMNDPELAADFHEFIAHLLSEQLATSIRTLGAVLNERHGCQPDRRLPLRLRRRIETVFLEKSGV
jgi:hypothetical protein